MAEHKDEIVPHWSPKQLGMMEKLMGLIQKLDPSTAMVERATKLGYIMPDMTGLIRGYNKLSMQAMFLSEREWARLLIFSHKACNIPLQEFENPEGISQDILSFFETMYWFQTHSTLNIPLKIPRLVLPAFEFTPLLEAKGNPVLLHHFEDICYLHEELMGYLDSLKNAQINHPQQKMVFTMEGGGTLLSLSYLVERGTWRVKEMNHGIRELAAACVNTETLASTIFNMLAPSEPNHMPVVSKLEEEILADAEFSSRLAEMEHLDPLCSPLSVRYDNVNKKFCFVNPQQHRAVFSMQIYGLSSIRQGLGAYLEDLIQRVGPDLSEDLHISLRHQNHTIDLIYRERGWILKDNNKGTSQQEKSVEEVGRFVLYCFAEISKDSVIRIQAESIFGQQLIEDPFISLLSDVLKRDDGLKPRLDAGKAVDADAYGNTLLHLCASNASHDSMRFLLDHGADPNKSNAHKNTPLKCAIVEAKDLEAAELLINGGADLNALIQLIPKLLFLFVNHPKIAEFLIESKADPRQHIDALSLLQHAASENNLHMVQRLLAHKVNPEAEEKHAMGRPLYLASERGFHEIAEELLTTGKTPVMVRSGDDDDAPIHRAAIFGHDQLIKLLLEHKAELDTGNKKANTALQFAANLNHPTTVKLLLDQHANPEQQNVLRENRTPLIDAADCNNLQCAQHLIDAKASLDQVDSYGFSALHRAAEKGHVASAKLLLESRASLNLMANAANFGVTPLHVASQMQQVETTRLLLDCNAEPNKCSTFQNTPLHQAVATFGLFAESPETTAKRKEVIRLLLEKKANPDLANREGVTFRQIAAEEKEFAECLEVGF